MRGITCLFCQNMVQCKKLNEDEILRNCHIESKNLDQYK